MLRRVLENNAKKRFESLNGTQITFHEHKKDESSFYVIKNTTKLRQKEMCYVFLLVTGLNLINVFYEIVNVSFSIVVYLGTLFYFLRLINSVRKESLLVIPKLGFQIDIWYSFKHSSKFFPWESIEDVFINEVISRQRVIFVLTILTKQQKLIPLFQGTSPRLDLIELIYRKLNKILTIE